MILKGRLTESNEACAYCGVFISDDKGNPIDGASGVNGVTTDDDGNYEIQMVQDEFITFRGNGSEKTFSFDDLNCGSEICENSIDLSGSILPEVNVVAVKSFWDKYKYWIIGGSILIVSVLLFLKFRKK
jgi:hypothetical protein